MTRTRSYILIERTGGPERLQLRDGPLPTTAAGEVLIANEAVGVAFADVLIREGLYPGVKLPATPGYEAVGRVIETGAGAEAWFGRRVAALTVTGGYASHLIVPAADLVAVPDGLPSPAAAALVLNGLTAWQMLTRTAPAGPIEKIMVWGAAGGVGSLLLDMARARGLQAYGVCSPERAAFVAGRGATPVLCGRHDVAAEVRRLSGGGVDAVFDGVGGRTSSQSFAALRSGGSVILFGMQGGMSRGRRGLKTAIEYFRAPRWSMPQLLLSGRGVAGYLVTDYKVAHPDHYREDLALLFDMATRGVISPEIGLTLPLAQAAEAHVQMNAGTVPGKIVLLP